MRMYRTFLLSLPFLSSLLSSVFAQEVTKVSEEFVYETAPFPSCHASTIAQTSDGTIVTAWFGGKHEKADDVGIWSSRWIQQKWTAPVELANGVQYQWVNPVKDKDQLQPVKRYPTWNPVLFQPKNGPLLLFYKCGPSPRSWWGMMMESHDQGATWSKPIRLPEGILGPIKNKPIELADGTILCPTSNESNDDKDEWTVHFESTRDLGKTWSRTVPLNNPTLISAIQPSILQLGGNKLLAIGRSKQSKLFQIESPNLGKDWGEMALIDLPNPNSGTDAVTLANGKHVLIYNHVTKESSQWGGRRSPLNVAISDNGKDWRTVAELENEPKQEFSYPAVIQTRDGRVHVTYTWKRLKIKHVVLDIK